MQTRSRVQSSDRVCSARPSFAAGQFQSWHRADATLFRPVAPRALQAITLLDTVTASGPLVDLAATDTSSLNAAAFVVATVAVAAYSYWQQQQQGDSSTTATSPDVGSAKPSEWASMAATPSASVTAPAPPQPATPEPQPETDDVDSWIAHWRSTSGATTPIDTLNASDAAVAAGAALGADTASDSSAAGTAGAATEDAPIVPEVARVDEASVVAAAAAAAARDAAKGSATSAKGTEAASPHPLDMPSAGNARLQAGANVERNAGNGTWNPIVLLLRLLARMWRWVMSLFSGGSASSGDAKTA